MAHTELKLYNESLSLYDSLFTNKRNQNRVTQFIDTKKQLITLAKETDNSDLRTHKTLWDKKNTEDYLNVEFALPLMQSEFSLRFAAIQLKERLKQKVSDNEYKTCLLFAYELLKHAHSYVHTKNIKDYTKQIKDLETRLGLGTETVSTGNKSVFDKKAFTEDWTEFFQTILHSSGIRAWIGLVNLERIALVCAKVAVTLTAPISSSTVAVFKDSSALSATTDVFYGLSVGLYAVRIIEEALVSNKHVFYASEVARLATTRLQRFLKEIVKRHIQFLNDFVWLTVNFLTNYIQISKLSIPLANQLLVVFLLFDVLLVAYGFLFTTRRDHLLKKMQIEIERRDVVETDELRAQNAQIENNWNIKTQTAWFNIFAASVVLAGFVAGLFTTTSYMLPVYFAICVLGIALYLSVENFENYLQKQQEYKDLCSVESASAIYLTKDCNDVNAAWNKFVMGLTEQTVVPLIIVTVFAINWPAGLALALLYLTCKGNSKYLHLENVNVTKSQTQQDEESAPLLVHDHTI